MQIIGRNEASNILIGFSEDGHIWNVPFSKAGEMSVPELEAFYEDVFGSPCKVVPNFTFTATLVPYAWASASESGSVLFEDVDDGRKEFRMTQRHLLDLLGAIIVGTVTVDKKNGGFYGLYTFDARQNMIAIKVYDGGGNA